MYCVNCGNKVNPDLKYCNSCGVRIADSKPEKRRSRTDSLSRSFGFFGVAGIFGCFLLVKILLDSVIDPGAIVMIVLAYLATIFGISYLLIKQLSGNVTRTDNNPETPREIPPALNRAQTNQLEAPSEAPASVVEDTTRTLDKSPVWRK